MTIHLMRQIDYWVGVPLCLALSLFDGIVRLLHLKKKKGSEPKKILFIKPSEMGGIILSVPLMRRVQDEYSDATMFFLTFESNKSLFDVLDVIKSQNVLTIRDQSMIAFMSDVIRVVLKIRKEKIDMVFDLEFFSRFTAIIAYCSGASKRVGFYRYTLEGLYRGNLLTHKVPYNPNIHITKSFLFMGQALRQPDKTTPESEQGFGDQTFILPQFILSEEQKENMRNLLGDYGVHAGAKLYLMNPGEGRIPLREWPMERFILLSRKLLEEGNSYIIQVGASEDHSKTSDLFASKLKNQQFVNLNGRTSITELLTLFTMAEALIVNDSGLAHLASLTPLRQFVLFGPESPHVFSPLGNNVHVFYSNLPCSPCLSAYNHRASACRNNQCLHAISPQEVYRAISRKKSLQIADKI